MSRNFSPTTKKVLLLLSGGLALGVARSPNTYFRVIKEVGQEWKKINNKKLNESIKTLYQSKLISAVEDKNGILTMTLNDAGKKKVLVYQLDDIKIEKPKRWDGLWRVIAFDIPEKHRKAREALRRKLRELGFYQLQKSILVLPYECKNEIDFIIEIFQIRLWVRYMIVKDIDNSLHLKKLFDLI
ncbi:MAG: hypothetical protein AAB946_01905 [Patescibacteria group bacterium]